jgi:hypothetical protein
LGSFSVFQVLLFLCRRWHIIVSGAVRRAGTRRTRFPAAAAAPSGAETAVGGAMVGSVAAAGAARAATLGAARVSPPAALLAARDTAR